MNKFRNVEEQHKFENVTAYSGRSAVAVTVEYVYRDGTVQENNYQKDELDEYLLMMLNVGGFLALASIVFCMAMLISTS